MTADKDIILDELDLEILGHLETNGRKPFTVIAKDLGVSVGTVHNRISRMVDNKTVTFFGRINPFHAGLHAFALIFIAVKPPQLIEKAVEAIVQYPEVSFLGIVAGDFDIHIDAMCRDNDHLHELVYERIHRIEGVVDTKVVPILRIQKWVQPSLQLLRDHHLNKQHFESGKTHKEA